MMRKRAGVQVAMSAGTFLLLALGGSGAAPAEGIEWGTNGAFQACLDALAKQWIDVRVELVVNEDPAAGNIDDRAVAAWTAQGTRDLRSQGRARRPSLRAAVREIYVALARTHRRRGD